MMLWKCCTQYASKLGKLSSGHRTGKGQFSFQSQRKAMPKNVQTTTQLDSSHTLAKQLSKFSKPGFNSTWIRNFQMLKLDLEKPEEPEIKLPTSVRSLEKQESSKKISTSGVRPFSHQGLWLCSVQFSHSVVSDSLWPHESQHARPPCPSPTPRVHSDSRPLSLWCHAAVSSSVIPFFSCPQSLPASKSFPVSQLFTWGGQSTGVSALASVLPKKSQGWSPLEWTGWISLQSKGLSRVFSNTEQMTPPLWQKVKRN